MDVKVLSVDVKVRSHPCSMRKYEDKHVCGRAAEHACNLMKQWYTSAILACRKPRQELHEFEATLGYRSRPSLINEKVHKLCTSLSVLGPLIPGLHPGPIFCIHLNKSIL